MNDKKINLTNDEKIKVLAQNSKIPSIRNNINLDNNGKVQGLKEIPTQIFNEWVSEITNKILAQKYGKQLDMSVALAKLASFKTDVNWINGQIELLASNIKATTDYSKSLVFDDIYNTDDRETAVAFLYDSFKKQSRVKVDNSVITRAQASSGNFMEYVMDIVNKLQDDINVQFDKDLRIDFFQTILPALLINIEVDTSGFPIAQEKLAAVNEAILNLIKKFGYPTTLYNPIGYLASCSPSNSVLIWRDDVKTEIDTKYLATAFHKSLRETGIEEKGLQFAEGIYAMLMDKRSVLFDITLEQSGTVNLDGFQTSFAKRMWYGIGQVPFYNQVIITETGTIPPLIEKAKSTIANMKLTYKDDKPMLKFIKSVEKAMNQAQSFNKKFSNEILKSIPTVKVESDLPSAEIVEDEAE